MAAVQSQFTTQKPSGLKPMEKTLLQMDPPALLMDPRVPSATPKSSGGQLNGASVSDAVSMMPTEKHAISINAIPFALSPGLTETMAAENAVRAAVETIKINR
jgi:hypothetical protein